MQSVMDNSWFFILKTSCFLGKSAQSPCLGVQNNNGCVNIKKMARSLKPKVELLWLCAFTEKTQPISHSATPSQCCILSF